MSFFNVYSRALVNWLMLPYMIDRCSA